MRETRERPGGESSRRMGQQKRRAARREVLLAYVFMAPALLLALPFKIIPLGMGVINSFETLNGFGGGTQFAGIANYKEILQDPAGVAAFKNALMILSTLPIWVLVPLILAVLIYERTAGWRIYRALYFLPYTIAPIIVGIMFRQILDPSGPLDSLLRTVALKSVALPWLQNAHTALWSLDGIAFWSFFGLGVLVYLGGLSALSTEVMEAAVLDGAGYWARLRRVVIPLIRPVIGYWTVLCASGMFVWLFPLIYSLTQGGPGFATMLPEYLTYQTIFTFLERGYGTAIGIALFCFVAVISGFTVRYMYVQGGRKEGHG